MSPVRPTNLAPATPLPTGASVAATYSGDDADWTTSGEGTNVALDYLIDVNVPTPADQDVLTWDAYLGEWVAQAPSGGGTYEALTDVDMTGITDGQIPVWDSYTSTWLPGNASAVTEITDLATAETDTTLRLAPDGAGGVEWAAGGGGSVTDYVSGISGSGHIIIPGIAASPDIAPGGGSDDEFNTTNASGVTGWTNYATSGALDAIDENTTAKSHAYLRAPTDASTTNIYGIYKAATPPFTVSAKLSAIGGDSMGWTAVGLAVSTATASSATYAYIRLLCAAPQLQLEISTVGGSTPGVFLTPVWFRIVVASSTDVSYYFSNDGQRWLRRLASTNPGFTVGSVLLFIRQQNASLKGEAIWDYVRFT